MSRCISSEGEYSDHELPTTGLAVERFVCRRCHGLAEDELLAALDAAEAAVARVRAVRTKWDTDPYNCGQYNAPALAAKIDAALDGTGGGES